MNIAGLNTMRHRGGSERGVFLRDAGRRIGSASVLPLHLQGGKSVVSVLSEGRGGGMPADGIVTFNSIFWIIS